MNMKKIWSAPVALVVVLTMALFFGGITVSADEVGSGSCGDNATWSYDDNGTLAISGTGAMEDYYFHSTPWESYRESITSVVIGDGITYVSDNAFNGFTNLSSVSIGTGVEYIGVASFKNCTSLSAVGFPNNFDEIASNAFEGCSNLATVNLGNSITSIGYGAFKDCGKLTSITIPSSVEYIEGQAFYNSGLASLEFSAKIKTLGQEAFYNCGSLTEVNIEFTSNEVGIAERAFANCGNLSKVTLSGNLDKLGYGMFSNCYKLTTVVLPDSVTEINDYAFSYSESLNSITIPENLKTIGAYAFSDCRELSSFTIPSGVTEIKEDAFYDSGLTTVVMPDTVTTWGAGVFSSCSELETVTIPQGVTAIPENMFYGCYKLSSVQIPSSVTSIGERAFAQCPGITTITIPSSVQNMGEYAFNSCENLKTVIISEGVTAIGPRVFSNCTSLDSISIPSTVTTIGDGAFYSTNFSSFTIPATVTSIGKDVFAGSKLTSITIPGTIETVSENAFEGCPKLKYVELQEGVKTIEYYAFHSCQALETVIIPSTITSIDKDAFYQCWHVYDVFCKAQPVFVWNEDGDDFIEPDYSKKTICHVGDGLAAQFAEKYPNANVTFKDGLKISPKVVGHSISLSADIGVNFYVKLPEEYNRNNTEVTFSWGEEDYARSTTCKLTPISQYGANYMATCEVAARSMGDTITMVVKSGNTVLISNEYSVAKYIDVLLLSRNGYEEEDLCRLLYAMVMYGHYTQSYFGYSYGNDVLYCSEKIRLISGDIKDEVNWEADDLNYVSADPAKMTIVNIANDDIGLAYAGNSVLCTSQTKIRFYFRITDQAKYNALVANYPSLKFVSKTVNGENLVYLDTRGLKAGELENAIEITIGNKVYKYDFLDYISRVGSVNYDFTYVAQYMYLYSKYARIYQEGNKNA